jgi:hypothetical protein
MDESMHAKDKLDRGSIVSGTEKQSTEHEANDTMQETYTTREVSTIGRADGWTTSSIVENTC